MKYLLILILCVIIIWMLNIKIIEGASILDSGPGKIDVKEMKDMREFLEQMYMICLLNPNDSTSKNIRNTICYKCSILGSYLWPALGPYTYSSLEQLTPLYGEAGKPTSDMEKSAQQQNTTPPPVPIIVNDMDYQSFIQLAILGQLLQPFTIEDANGWNSDVIWFRDRKDRPRDACKEYWGGYQSSIGVITDYFEKIKTLLAYFHGQTQSKRSIHYGDSIYTKDYSVYSEYDPSSTQSPI